MTNKLKEQYKVQFDQIDFTGAISLNGICNQMQVIAANHASLLGINYYKNNGMPDYYWIISKVKYIMDAYPRWEDTITMTTYPGGYDKLYAVRLFDLFNEKEERMGHIIGDYLLMDVAKKRPVRIKGAEGGLEFLDFPYEGERLGKLKLPEVTLQEDIRRAYYSEMDLNGHMNNAHYIRWSVDMLPIELLKENEISTLEINYNMSVTYGMNVKIGLGQDEEGAYIIYGNSEDDKINYFITKVTFRKRLEKVGF